MDADEARKNHTLMLALKRECSGLEVGSLDAGDYQTYRDTDEGPKNCLTIESKTVSDLVLSSRPEPGRIVGRLWRQVSKAQELGDVVVLLRGVPDRASAFLNPGTLAAYVGIIAALGKSHVPTIPCGESVWATAATVAAIFRKHQKGPEGSKRSLTARPLPGVPWQVSMFAQIPGIGARRATMLLERVGNVGGLTHATLAELQEVLGKEAGRKLLESLKEKVK
jgi:ERCC4-type nuclease